MIFYVDKLPMYNDWAAGVAIGPFIWIKHDFKSNKGLLEHERLHTKMFWLWFLLFSIIAFVSILLEFYTGFSIAILFAIAFRAVLYSMFNRYRLWEEVKAYAIQWKINKEPEVRLQVYARAIVKHYRLSISEEEALEKLQNELARSH